MYCIRLLSNVCEGGQSFTLPSQTKTSNYHHTLSEEDWISWHKQSQFLIIHSVFSSRKLLINSVLLMTA